MRISAVTIQNFKGIRNVSLDCDKSLILIAGKNGAGKSSALDAITCLLLGKDALPVEPLRRGETEGKIEAVIDGYLVRRTFTRREDGTVSTNLTITSTDGAKYPSPQAWLNARLTALGCDPIAFATAKAADQAAQLRALIGLDTAAIDSRRKAAFDARTEIGRVGTTEKGALESMPHYGDAPADLVVAPVVTAELVTAPMVSAAEIVAELERATATQRERDAAERTATAKAVAHVAAEAAAAAIAEKIEAARAALVKLESDAIVAAEAERDAERAATEASQLAGLVAVIPAAPIRERLAAVEQTNAIAREEAARTNAAALQTANEANAAARALADATNAKVRANAARKAQEERVAKTRAEYVAKTREIEAADTERAALLAAAKFPIAGLSINDDGLVTFEGIPLSQQNEATRIRVSMAIALAGDKPLKLVLIRNGSQLDEDSMALVSQLADDAGAQLFVELVGTNHDGAVVIADGGVA